METIIISKSAVVITTSKEELHRVIDECTPQDYIKIESVMDGAKNYFEYIITKSMKNS